jgi:hypothetical protein
MRIIRQYSKGQLTESAAKTLLRTGLGLNDEDVNSLLGIESVPVQMSFEQQDEIIAFFDSCGDSKNDFEVLKSKRVSFSSDTECKEDESVYIQEAFKTKADLTATENKIIEFIKKDKKVTPKVIADAIGESEAFVKSKIANLVKRGIIEQKISTDGVDKLIERAISNDIDLIPPPIKPGAVNPTRVFIKYSYEGPEDNRNRPFCAKMMALHRLYSRADIESFSARFGYSVFDRRGGFWTRKGTNDTTPYCRHNWKSNLIVQK